MPTQEQVDRALDAATENGYSVVSCTARAVAIDLLVYDSDLEGEPTEENISALLPLVVDWQARKYLYRAEELRGMRDRGV